MNISAIFINRPVATTLLTIGLVIAGAIAFQMLPVSPLPRVDFPTIFVSANLPGADPETMATSVAAPLERQFGRIAGITEMTSASSRGSTSIVLQFDLSRDINGAARDVQAGINAARGFLPPNLPNNPTYRKVNPSEGAGSDHWPDVGHGGPGEDVRCRIQHPGAEVGPGRRGRPGHRRRWLAARCSCGDESPDVVQIRDQPFHRPRCSGSHQRQPAQGAAGGRSTAMGDRDERSAPESRGLSVSHRQLPIRCRCPAQRCCAGGGFGGGSPRQWYCERQAGHLRYRFPSARRQYHRDGRQRAEYASLPGGKHARRGEIYHPQRPDASYSSRVPARCRSGPSSCR